MVQSSAVVGCSSISVQRVLRKTGGVKSRTVARSIVQLSLLECEEISLGFLAGHPCRAIADRLDRAPSTVSRDVAAGAAG